MLLSRLSLEAGLPDWPGLPVGLILYSAVTVTCARARPTSTCTSDTVNRRVQRSFTSLCTNIDAIAFEEAGVEGAGWIYVAR